MATLAPALFEALNAAIGGQRNGQRKGIHHENLTVEGGAPLGKTKRVDSHGASDRKNEVCGYSVVQAESHDAATKIFGKDHPHLQMPGAWIEVMEIMPLREM
jgi:hypothetical protein